MFRIIIKVSDQAETMGGRGPCPYWLLSKGCFDHTLTAQGFHFLIPLSQRSIVFVYDPFKIVDPLVSNSLLINGANWDIYAC